MKMRRLPGDRASIPMRCADGGSASPRRAPPTSGDRQRPGSQGVAAEGHGGRDGARDDGGDPRRHLYSLDDAHIGQAVRDRQGLPWPGSWQDQTSGTGRSTPSRSPTTPASRTSSTSSGCTTRPSSGTRPPRRSLRKSNEDGRRSTT